MPSAHPFFTYTSQVLAFRLGDARPSGPFSAAAPPGTAAWVARILRAAARHRSRIVLFGLGSGHLAAALAEGLPPEASLTVCALDPEAARAVLETGRLAWRRPDGPGQLLADTSAAALFSLLVGADLTPDAALAVVNPEAAPREADGIRRLRRLLLEARPLPVEAGPPAPPAVVFAAMLRPDEPGLPDFFAAAAGLGGSAVVIWDAAEVPEQARSAAALGVPVTHLARRLEGDFAAQRNAMLAACRGDWVVYLDADERPGPGFARAVALLAGAGAVGGVYFPRLTLYPDAGHAKAGYGLWPDWQLRLFRLGEPPPRFARPVHERLEGLAGRAALALDAPILHCSRLLKDEAALRQKLSGFDAAAGGDVHRLSRDYPCLPLAFFAPPAGTSPPGRVLLLPPVW